MNNVDYVIHVVEITKEPWRKKDFMKRTIFRVFYYSLLEACVIFMIGATMWFHFIIKEANFLATVALSSLLLG